MISKSGPGPAPPRVSGERGEEGDDLHIFLKGSKYSKKERKRKEKQPRTLLGLGCVGGVGH